MKIENGSLAQSRIIPPIPNEGAPQRVMIDRILRSILEREGTDLHAIAEVLTSLSHSHDSIHSQVGYAYKKVGDNVYDLTQRGLAPPVMSTSVLLGDARYHGNYLFVGELLPETLCMGAVGRRLGDVVSTGIPQIDDRLLLQVLTCHDGWPPTAGTCFRFAPDLIELGARRAETFPLSLR